MKKIAIVIFDDFTDIDLFLMWDILGRNKVDWQVNILGTKEQHRSTHHLYVSTHGHISEANDADVVLFSSGRIGVKTAIEDKSFLDTFSLNPNKQLIGSICSGALILARLGFLNETLATTHPYAKSELQALGVETIDVPLVCNGNIATAGGCLAATYLIGWVVERLFNDEKRKQTLNPILPAGQQELYEQLITSSIQQGMQISDARSKIQCA